MKKKIYLIIAAVMLLSLAACGKAKAAQGDSSQSSLDWAGVYNATTQGANSDMVITISLNQNQTFSVVTLYTEQPDEPITEEGNIQWDSDGTTITLENAGDLNRYKVAENMLIQLTPDGQDGLELPKVE